MRSISAASALAMLLAACGGGESTDNHGYGYAYDLGSLDGTRLRNLPGSLELTQADFEELVAEPYRATEKCAQIVTGGPLVVAVIMDETGYATIGRGNTFLDTGLIRATPQAIWTVATMRETRQPDGLRAPQPSGTSSSITCSRYRDFLRT